jgi:PEGA domain.
VQFSSIPLATLFVDGRKIGPSIPAQVVELPEGKHTLRFEAPDLPPYDKQFSVGSEGSPPIAYRFSVGFLVINTPAWAGANVLIDSKFKGILIGEKSFQVTAGAHRVTLSREGVTTYTGDVTVSKGEKKSFTPPAPTSSQENSS